VSRVCDQDRHDRNAEQTAGFSHLVAEHQRRRAQRKWGGREQQTE